MKPKLLLLSRPECELCEELEFALFTQFSATTFELERADVDSRPEWKTRYGLKIPVLLTAAGEVLCSTRFDAEAVADFLKNPG
ncbi:glutaredoxin family protein [Stenotrophobium rhamnosiphilum]|uniref:Thioredoxin family protein n=1 Tax=Stenotrophobium rhamnosiphilum TaxID=2029166 RepID=A0A2T5MKN8_9GAMM|nr:glutaredoxin family protein [Stenotrophobium rhamnosiphilum]PTU33135.1 thioredoxin family protein [Stenotrophobium rhamnosiphilum]